MDALLSAFLVCFLYEFGGSSQSLTLALAKRFEKDGIVLFAVASAALANAALSAAAGWYISSLIATNARTLLLALALLCVGGAMPFLAKKPDTLENWRIGAFATTFCGIFILGFGDAAQFVILGLSARMSDPLMAAIGGALGTIAACLPVVILRAPVISNRVALALRRTSGLMLLTIGAITGLSAINLL